jgi:hypothetical protein
VLAAVGALPWAESRVVQVVCGLGARPLARVARALEARGLIETAYLPARHRHALARYGLTPCGTRALGRVWNPVAQRAAFFTALRRDHALVALVRWLTGARLVWALAAYHLAAAAVRPEASGVDARARVPGARPYGPVDLDLITCLQLPDGRYRTLLVQVDGGGLRLDGLSQQLRSLAAWTRRAEFAGRAGDIPALIVLTASERRAQLIRDRWGSEHRGPPSALRVFVVGEPVVDGLPARPGDALPELDGLPCTTRPAQAPLGWGGCWWAEREATSGVIEASATSASPGARAPRSKGVVATALGRGARCPRPQPGGVLSDPRVAGSSGADPGAGDVHQRLRDLVATPAFGRVVLERVGLYPLTNASGLADLLGADAGDVRRTLSGLARQGLVQREPDGAHGCVLSPRGLALLAALSGLPPARYARERYWAVQVAADGTVQVALAAYQRQRQHDQEVWRFLRALRHMDPRRGLVLTEWQHGAAIRERLREGPDHEVQLIPDARFTLRATGPRPEQWVETTCWLEIDRHTMEGQALRRKLQRYHRLRRDQIGLRGRPERLLFVVPAGDEGRVQTLRRRLRELDARHAVRLDAWVTRWDLIRHAGVDDPTRPIWRTAHEPELRSSFREWKDP